MLFKFKLEKTESLKKTISVIKSIANDMTIKVTQYGVVISVVDDANTCLIHIDVTAHEIKLIDAEEYVISVDIDKFYKILTHAEGIFTIEQNVTDRLCLYNETETYTVALIDSVGSQAIPDMVFNTICMIPSGVVSSAIKSSLNINDTVSLSSTMFLSAENEQCTSLLQLKLGFTSTENLSRVMTKPQLTSIAKLSKLSKNVSISMMDGLPLRTIFATELGTISFFIH